VSLTGRLGSLYLKTHPGDAARVAERMPLQELLEELGEFDADALTPLLDYLTPVRAAEIFRTLATAEQQRVLTQASARLAVVLLNQLDDEERRKLLDALPAGLGTDLNRQLEFPEGTAGRLMDSTFSTFRPDMTVAEALGRLRDSGARSLRTVFLVDDDNLLLARVDVQDMALADSDSRLEAIMQPATAAVSALAQRDEIVDTLDRQRIDALPVVDAEHRLMGVVRYGSLFAAIESVASADLQRMVGSADERALSTAAFSVRKRLPWLHINLLTAFLAAAVVGLFESIIAQFTALAVLLPVVAGQSGNAGSQALAVTIRGLALKEIGLRQWRRVLNKEVWVGLVNGAALALTCGAGVWVWSQSLGLAIVIGVAMVLSMLAAGISGAIVPMVLTRLGQDPATASSIILTTVTDVAGFFSFLGTATLLSFML